MDGAWAHLGRLEGGRLDEGEIRISDELAREPEEGLLEVVVRLGRDVVVLQTMTWQGKKWVGKLGRYVCELRKRCTRNFFLRRKVICLGKFGHLGKVGK